MRKILPSFLILLGIILGSSGCREKSSVLPSWDEVLVYPLPYDLVYLKTLEAADTHPDWELDYTDKENGIIRIHNQRYSSFADADLRFAKLLIKRMDHSKSSVEFAPESRAIVGGDEILSLIKQSLSEEVTKRQPLAVKPHP